MWVDLEKHLTAVKNDRADKPAPIGVPQADLLFQVRAFATSSKTLLL